MVEDELIKYSKDKIRIFLILYIFSEPYSDSEKPHLKRIFTTETKIQKIDFLLRNPDYLAHELLRIAIKESSRRNDIKKIVKQIFDNREPVLKRLDMERFFFGAYEDIDDVISFLKSIGFIEFSSSKSIDLRTIDKKYYITEIAENKVAQALPTLPALRWYEDRCNLIKEFFGEKSGTQLKNLQYEILEYKSTTWHDRIRDIQEKVKTDYASLFGEEL